MIETQLTALNKGIGKACQQSGRKREEVELVLVTKQVSWDRVGEAYRLGIRNFGENRVQELCEKRDRLPDDIRWHLIGHLQTNKVKHVVGNVVLVHSCDRLNLAEALQKECEKKKQFIDVLLQVNVSGERTKQGFGLSGVEAAVEKMKQLDRVRIKGLMTIGPFTQDDQAIQSAFRSLRVLRDGLLKSCANINWQHLSMGMSHDFKIAIAEGANMIRVGSAVFGARQNTT
jgi:PLP dependent protein